MVGGFVVTTGLFGGGNRLKRVGDPFERTSNPSEGADSSLDILDLATSEWVTHQ
jgi:hypothetical protein